MTETKRRRLANILPKEIADQEPAIQEQVAPESPGRNEGATAKTTSVVDVETPAAGRPRRPRFADFERKEARLRQDQLDALDVLARKIKRARTPGVGERITDNTLIRIAVDLLLARQEELSGSTEDELRASVSL